MVPPCRWFTNQLVLALKFLTAYVHRSTLPQSRFARQLPQGGSRETSPHNINHPPAGYLVSGRVIFAGSGWEGCFAIQPGACETVGVRAIFIAPTKAQKFLHFTIQRGTLPQSRPLGVTAPSGREPGRAVPFIGVLAKIRGWRAIFIAPTKAQRI